ncbi:SDR family oxidoreductase [Actinomadura chokoriensis]|uniref:SDR family oxidoreductase n=1 Tax=Actinomadura chokoriensis TaxID=454156 RepID=A0ABV4R4X2_9ACTN
MPQFQERMAFHGRTAVITGAASGIGAAAVEKFRAGGAKVIGVDRVPAAGPDLHIVGDLGTRAGVEDVAERIDQPIDILVNNAGVAATQPWRTVLGVNALAPRDLTRLLLPRFNPDPVVVTTASMAGFMWAQNYGLIRRFLETENWEEALDLVKDHPDLDTSCYNLSKEIAIVNAGDLAVNGKHINLRSNSVSPGFVGTPLLGDFVTTMGAENIDGTVAWAGRHATAEEVADAICFLASPLATWVNGVDLAVDGGLNAMVFRNYIAPAMAAMTAGGGAS